MLYKQKRFNEFVGTIEEINSKTLSLRLHEMEEDGLITRKVFPEIPPRVEYSLTEKGRSLRPILEQMGEFSTKFCSSDVFKDGKPRSFKQIKKELQE